MARGGLSRCRCFHTVVTVTSQSEASAAPAAQLCSGCRGPPGLPAPHMPPPHVVASCPGPTGTLAVTPAQRSTLSSGGGLSIALPLGFGGPAAERRGGDVLREKGRNTELRESLAWWQMGVQRSFLQSRGPFLRRVERARPFGFGHL